MIRILVVDDSMFMRGAIAKTLTTTGAFEVVGQARDGKEALQRVLELKPDVVSMDFNMPGWTGIDAIHAIMQQRPTPIVMFSAHTQKGARETLDALTAGAVDFVTKPAGEVSADLSKVQDELVRKLTAAAGARPRVPASGAGTAGLGAMGLASSGSAAGATGSAAGLTSAWSGSAATGRGAPAIAGSPGSGGSLSSPGSARSPASLASPPSSKPASGPSGASGSSATSGPATAVTSGMSASSGTAGSARPPLSSTTRAVIPASLRDTMRSDRTPIPGMTTTAAMPTPRPSSPGGALPRLCVIAVSTGGPVALTQLIPALPADTRFAIVIVQHMPAHFTAALAERLDADSALEVREAAHGDRPRPGLVLIAPGDQHLEFDDRGTVVLNSGPLLHGCRPAADVTMLSAARVFGRRTIGVVMTGMGKDGTAGALAIRRVEGKTLAQDEESSVIFGMPKAAIEAGAIEEVAPLGEIAARLRYL